MARQVVFLTLYFLLLPLCVSAQRNFTAVSYNCENLFDVRHDSLKNDEEFLPDGERAWTAARYRQKLNDIGRVILQCGGERENWTLPDLVGLVEVENDSVMLSLTRRSMLRGAHYNYVMTSSPDERGIDVALLYNPFRFRLIHSEQIVITPLPRQRPTRNILYSTLLSAYGDTLHAFVVHAPSRSGGQHLTEDYRLFVVDKLLEKIDSIRSAAPMPKILLMGDFNDYSHNKSVKKIIASGMEEASSDAVGKYHPQEVVGTYYFRRQWESLDHVFVSSAVKSLRCFIYDADWLLDTNDAGNHTPRRTYLGTHYHGGVSDHLPLVLHFHFPETNTSLLP